MRIAAALVAILALGAGSAVQRGVLTVPADIEGDFASGPAFALAQAEQVVELVRATRTIAVDPNGDGRTEERPSDLRVSLVVLDLGPATDVSPRQALHLALFNDITEYGMAWALEPVADVWTFLGVARAAPGIYVIDAEIAPLVPEDCVFPQVQITVDARALSVAVRNAPGLYEFDARRYREPIGVEVEPVGCRD